MSTITPGTLPDRGEGGCASVVGSLRRPRWCLLAMGACVAALGVAGCGGGSGTGSSSVPKIQRAANGNYFAVVKDAAAAHAACTTQRSEVAQQLKKLGAGGATTTPGALGYGTVVQSGGTVVVAFRYGPVSTTGSSRATICAVSVPK